MLISLLKTSDDEVLSGFLFLHFVILSKLAPQFMSKKMYTGFTKPALPSNMHNSLLEDVLKK